MAAAFTLFLDPITCLSLWTTGNAESTEWGLALNAENMIVLHQWGDVGECWPGPLKLILYF